MSHTVSGYRLRRGATGDGHRPQRARAVWGAIAAGTTLVIVAAALAVPPGRASAAGVLPGFATPVASGIQGYGYEQSLRIDPSSGEVYTSAPDSLSSLTSWVWHSKDHGQTFKWVPAEVQPQGKPPTCAGGGDSELAVDSAGHLYLNDLTLANFSTSRSDDRGSTFTTSCTGVPGTAVDRQWYATNGDPTNGGSIALAYDRLAQSAPGICGSNPPPPLGGNVLTLNLSPLSSSAGASAGVTFGPPQTISCDEGIMGNDEMFDYGAGTGGLRVFVVHDNAALTSVSMGRCDVVGISLTAPTGFANCTDTLISSFPNSVTGANFPTMSVDTSGRLHAIWEQAPGAPGAVTGDTGLEYATSSDQGNTWKVSPLPTPQLNTNVYAWIAAGDSGRADVAWYGSAAGWRTGDSAGPDSISGDFGLYVTQTLDSGATWSQPVLASEHFIHRGTWYTLIGGQTGNRSLGDFLQLRIGAQGEANVSYGDSNNIVSGITPQAMYVRQNSGPSVLAAQPTVTGVPQASTTNSVSDPAGDATFDSGGRVSSNIPNLDLTGASISQPDPQHYQITMNVTDLTSLTPSPAGAAGGPVELWQMQWHVPQTAPSPSNTDSNGGKLFFVYMESQGGQPPTCWDGENATTFNGGGVLMTYPGANQIAASGCSITTTAPGAISITAPVSDFLEPGGSNILYSATASTQLLTAPAESSPSFGGVGGEPFSLVDVAPAFDFNPANPTTPPSASASASPSASTSPSASPSPSATPSATASSSPSPSASSSPSTSASPSASPSASASPSGSASPSSSPTPNPPPQPTGGVYRARQPARICDTRPVQPGVAANQCNNGAAGGTPIGPGGTLTIDVCSGAGSGCSLTAVVLNVTVAEATDSSFLTVYPFGGARPNASNLNFTPGDKVADLVEVAVGANGTVNLYNNTGSVDVVVDLEGTVAPGPISAGSPGLYTPLPPQRVCDTRADQPGVTTNQCNNGGSGSTVGSDQTLTVQVSGKGGVPIGGVAAVVLNLTATDTSGSSFLTAWPAGNPRPVASNVNWVAGQTVPNRVIVPVSRSGQVSVYNLSGATDVVIDVGGWFGDGSGSPPPGTTFTGVTPTRICDTRSDQPGVAANQCNNNGAGSPLQGGKMMPVQVTGGIVPAGARAVVATVTVTDTTAPSFLTVWPSDVSQPIISDLNWAAGEKVPNLVVVELSTSGQISVFNWAGQTDVLVDVVGYYS